ncbi:MAG TPA: selenide, water dikinase SelD [Candidatus Binatia bacterium]|nr:selenide, water dikinase SelD [Candidatus Binatia bacterium]
MAATTKLRSSTKPARKEPAPREPARKDPPQKQPSRKEPPSKEPARKSPPSKPGKDMQLRRQLRGKGGRLQGQGAPRIKESQVRLTAEVSSGGCACKLGPADLRGILARLPVLTDRNVLVGTETADDAGVYRLSPSQALVATVDFFPPMVDDPYTFGQVAATNALSDVYAMGGKPMLALSIVAYPTAKLPMDVLLRIMEGAAERVRAAGAVIVGGHSVIDEELKYGLAVIGSVHPKRIFRNGGARPGDELVLTKPLGTGIVCSGIKKRVAHQDEIGFATASMTTLNDVAGGLLHEFGARACTDVTGFGLAGHANEMAEASGDVRIEIDSQQLPLLPGTARLAEEGFLTGGSKRNRDWLGTRLSVGADVAPALREAAIDPQTSGGLLVALKAGRAERFVEALHKKGLRPALIGRVVERSKSSRVTVAIH